MVGHAQRILIGSLKSMVNFTSLVDSFADVPDTIVEPNSVFEDGYYILFNLGDVA
jgi:hypothetical protein